MDPFIVIRWMSLVISMLCLFQVTANGSRSVELKDGDYLIFNMETMPQSIKSFEKYNVGEDYHQHEAVFSLSFCPGDDKLLVGGEEGCYLFDSKGSKLLYRFTNERTRATAFSPDGMITAVGSTKLSHTSERIFNPFGLITKKLISNL